jgi:hypothetical protein
MNNLAHYGLIIILLFNLENDLNFIFGIILENILFFYIALKKDKNQRIIFFICLIITFIIVNFNLN